MAGSDDGVVQTVAKTTWSLIHPSSTQLVQKSSKGYDESDIGNGNFRWLAKRPKTARGAKCLSKSNSTSFLRRAKILTRTVTIVPFNIMKG